MLPSGWLGELMVEFDWAPNCNLVTDSVGNFNLVDTKYVVCHDDHWLFIGTAQAPVTQMCCCCLLADGVSHDCVKHHPRQVFLKVPCGHSTPGECMKVTGLAVKQAKVLGTASEVFHFVVCLPTDVELLAEIQTFFREGTNPTKVPSPTVDSVASHTIGMATASGASDSPLPGFSVHSPRDPCTPFW